MIKKKVFLTLLISTLWIKQCLGKAPDGRIIIKRLEKSSNNENLTVVKMLEGAYGLFGSKEKVEGKRLVLPPQNNAFLCLNRTHTLNPPSSSSSSSNGNVVLLVPRGRCSFQEKALVAQFYHSASAILIYNTLESRYGFNQSKNTLQFPKPITDYECQNGMGTIDLPASTLHQPYDSSRLNLFLNATYNQTQCHFISSSSSDNNKCASQLCLLVGVIQQQQQQLDNNSSSFKTCCAWDIFITMASQATARPVDIPSLFLTIRLGTELQTLMIPESNNSTTTDFVIDIVPKPKKQIWDGSLLLLWLWAIGLTGFAACWSAKDYKRAQTLLTNHRRRPRQRPTPPPQMEMTVVVDNNNNQQQQQQQREEQDNNNDTNPQEPITQINQEEQNDTNVAIPNHENSHHREEEEVQPVQEVNGQQEEEHEIDTNNVVGLSNIDSHQAAGAQPMQQETAQQQEREEEEQNDAIMQDVQLNNEASPSEHRTGAVESPTDNDASPPPSEEPQQQNQQQEQQRVAVASSTTTSTRPARATSRHRSVRRRWSRFFYTNNPMTSELTVWQAILFIVVASVLLILLFWLEFYAAITILYGVGCSTSLSQLVFYPLYTWICNAFWKLCTKTWPQAAAASANVSMRFKTMLVHLFALMTAYSIGAIWLYIYFTVSNPIVTHPFYWITQNIMGASITIVFLSLLKLNSIKVATILLVAIFLYDVFFVFITPLFTTNGDSIMVTVATGGPQADGDFCEKYPDNSQCSRQPLPMVFAFPRISGGGGYVLLGLGDVVLPGLLLSYAARLDEAKRLVGNHTNIRVENIPLYSLLFVYGGSCMNWIRGRRRHWHYRDEHDNRRPRCGFSIAIWIAYSIGLFLAGWAVIWLERGQPALLYIAPLCLGTLVWMGRRELQSLWKGPTRVLVWAERLVVHCNSPSFGTRAFGVDGEEMTEAESDEEEDDDDDSDDAENPRNQLSGIRGLNGSTREFT